MSYKSGVFLIGKGNKRNDGGYEQTDKTIR